MGFRHLQTITIPPQSVDIATGSREVVREGYSQSQHYWKPHSPGERVKSLSFKGFVVYKKYIISEKLVSKVFEGRLKDVWCNSRLKLILKECVV